MTVLVSRRIKTFLVLTREASDGIKPRVEQSETRGFDVEINTAREAIGGCVRNDPSVATRALSFRNASPGSALLHPGLYAVAVFDG
jgi:hypothetical protein